MTLQARPTEASSPRVILAVDDDASVRRLISQCLSRRYLVMSATNGAEATRMLRGRKVDLVLTDIRMPEMNGVDLAIHVREHYPEVPVAFVSAWLEDEGPHRLSRISPHRLAKPFLLEDLMNIVRRILEPEDPRGDERRHPGAAPPSPLSPRALVSAPPVAAAASAPAPPAHEAASPSPGHATPQAPARSVPPRLQRWSSALSQLSGGECSPAPPPASPPRPSLPLRPPAGRPLSALEHLQVRYANPSTERPTPSPAGPGRRALAPASEVGPQTQRRVQEHVASASLVYQARRRMACGRPLEVHLTQDGMSPLEQGDLVEVTDVDITQLRRGDVVYCQVRERLDFLRFEGLRTTSDGTFLLNVADGSGTSLVMPEGCLVGRADAVRRRDRRLSLGALAICNRLTGWLRRLQGA